MIRAAEEALECLRSSLVTGRTRKDGLEKSACVSKAETKEDEEEKKEEG